MWVPVLRRRGGGGGGCRRRRSIDGCLGRHGSIVRGCRIAVRLILICSLLWILFWILGLVVVALIGVGEDVRCRVVQRVAGACGVVGAFRAGGGGQRGGGMLGTDLRRDLGDRDQQGDATDLDHVVFFEFAEAFDEFVVDQCAIGRPEVADDPHAVLCPDFGVCTRHPRVGDQQTWCFAADDLHLVIVYTKGFVLPRGVGVEEDEFEHGGDLRNGLGTRPERSSG